MATALAKMFERSRGALMAFMVAGLLAGCLMAPMTAAARDVGGLDLRWYCADRYGGEVWLLGVTRDSWYCSTEITVTAPPSSKLIKITMGAACRYTYGERASVRFKHWYWSPFGAVCTVP